MISYGEEAIYFGSVVVFLFEDVVFGQYREVGVLLWRGFILDNCMNQCYVNQYDNGKGRQMFVYYGLKDFNFVIIFFILVIQMF